MAAAPLEHPPDHRHEVDARRGEHVLLADALSRLAVGLPGQQPGVHQLVQPRGGPGAGDADAPAEVVEPRRAVVSLLSIADLVPSSAIVFSMGHSPTADQASPSASLPHGDWPEQG